MVNKVPKTIKVWYLFFYVNIGKRADVKRKTGMWEAEGKEVVYVFPSGRRRVIVAEETGIVCISVLGNGQG